MVHSSVVLETTASTLLVAKPVVLLTLVLVLTLCFWVHSGDSITLTGALTSTSLNAGTGADSIVGQANMSAGLHRILRQLVLAQTPSTSWLLLSAFLQPPLRVVLVPTTSAFMALMMLSSILPLVILSSVELVQTPCSSLVLFRTTRFRQVAVATAS